MNISVCYVKGQSSGYEMKKNRLSGKLEVGSETKTVKHNTLVYSQMFMFKWKNKEKKDHIFVCEKNPLYGSYLIKRYRVVHCFYILSVNS